MPGFLEHVLTHVNAAEVELRKVREMIEKDTHPGLTSWMGLLDTRLKAAASEIEAARRMP